MIHPWGKLAGIQSKNMRRNHGGTLLTDSLAHIQPGFSPSPVLPSWYGSVIHWTLEPPTPFISQHNLPQMQTNASLIKKFCS